MTNAERTQSGIAEARTDRDGALLDIVGSVQRVFRGPKATRLAIKCETSPRLTFVDVVCFHRPPDIERGDRIHVSGRISSEKSGQKEIGKNGREYDKWVPMLIGEAVELLGEAQARIPGTGTRAANDNAQQDIDDIPF